MLVRWRLDSKALSLEFGIVLVIISDKPGQSFLFNALLIDQGLFKCWLLQFFRWKVQPRFLFHMTFADVDFWLYMSLDGVLGQ